MLLRPLGLTVPRPVDELLPVGGREGSKSRTVHGESDELVGLGKREEVRVVVADGDGSDLSKDVEEDIAVSISDPVALRFA